MKSTIQKNFFFNPSNTTLAYCSRCGKKILPDEYNLKKHARACGFEDNDLYEILNENSYKYALHKKNNSTLVFTVYKPVLPLRPGFQDRYMTGYWESIYEAHFTWNSKKVKEQGKNSLAAWLYLILEGKVHYFGNVPEGHVIASVFPVVPHIYDFLMFCHIYETKGYKVSSYQPSKRALDTHCHMREKEFFHGRSPDMHDKNTLISGECFEDQGYTLFALRIYHYTTDPNNPDFYSFIIGENILWKFQKAPLPADFYDDIWRMNILSLFETEQLQNFSRACPSFGLESYFKSRGKNLLIPLLCSGNFHKGIELLVKSENGWYADSYFTGNHRKPYRLFEVEPSPWSYSNVPEFLSLPKGILKLGPNHLLVNEVARKRVRHIYATNRKLIEGLTLNANILRFICGQDITHDRSVVNHISGLSSLSDEEIRRILKYLAKLKISAYEEYRDYLQMIHRTKVLDYGYCPKNLRQAHDNLALLLRSTKEQEENERFEKAVFKYKYLETIDEEFQYMDLNFEKEHYFIRCPHNVIDLYSEGRLQHNCVASYLDWIISGYCQILFMRDCASPDVPLVTIEVRHNQLIQAKAAYNRTASADYQKFVCKWCDHHGINYRGCSDITLRKAS